MEDFAPIIWDAKLSVHNDLIDSQHRELFSIVNRVIDLHKSGSSDLYPVLKDLVSFLSKHFHSEQMLMKEIRYPSFTAHANDHQSFIDKIQEFLEGYKEQDRDLTYKMLVFLRHWVLSHTTDIDMRYAAHLAMIRPGEQS